MENKGRKERGFIVLAVHNNMPYVVSAEHVEEFNKAAEKGARAFAKLLKENFNNEADDDNKNRK